MVSVLSFATGILIAAIAATWPSWAAARLAPMEAMRVE
jgi:ABC-type antimicrobial peptide transport system permease subunit